MNPRKLLKRPHSLAPLLCALGLIGSLVTAASIADAAPARQKAKAGVSPVKAPKSSAKARGKGPQGAAPAPAAAASPPSIPALDAAAAKPGGAVVKTEELRTGEKTYTFGAQEVEGRLKSPQILYFLRRVRAEFDPAPLGHRSFLLELSDTRRHPAFE
jgi:hypothetical protein